MNASRRRGKTSRRFGMKIAVISAHAMKVVATMMTTAAEGREARQEHREDATTVVRGTPLDASEG